MPLGEIRRRGTMVNLMVLEKRILTGRKERALLSLCEKFLDELPHLFGVEHFLWVAN
jgi:hypothetical protein